ncbi:MAG TPA: hypothetical protein VL979_06490 [Solirubrobacteraceae bacterium]|nr:hypothetical protein [Solirubrobacteraceae bacterium]
MIAVVHLVWGPLGPLSLRRFLDAYKRHPAGAEHELTVLLNGVAPAQRRELAAELGGIEHSMLELEQPMLDLSAYAWAARRLEHTHVCFLNSHSVPLAGDWLAKLARALELPRAGLVGATGSWGSFRSAVLNSLRLPSPYRHAPEPPRAHRRELWCEIERELERAEPRLAAAGPRDPRVHRLLSRMRSLPQLPERVLAFPGFPACHLRTNAFMAERAVFTALRTPPISRKMDALRLESGHHSYTSQVHASGLRALVVARDGRSYDPEEWAASHTFWQGAQERLLIADNRTAVYQNGSLERRQLLSARAWGSQAEPFPPECLRPAPHDEPARSAHAQPTALTRS